MENQKTIFQFILLFIALIVSGCARNVENKYYPVSEWNLVYKNSYSGESLYGSKEELIYALRAGSPLRIGFGGHREGDTLRSIEHMAEAEFISIANSTEVFAQINTVIGQRPKLNEEPLTMEFSEDRKFSLIAGTNGSVSSLTIDFLIDTLKTTQSQNRGFSWYVQKVSSNSTDQESAPIEPLWKNPRKR